LNLNAFVFYTMQQTDSHKATIKKIAKKYDKNFRKIRVFHENQQTYFLSNDVMEFIKSSQTNKAIQTLVRYTFKNFTEEEIHMSPIYGCWLLSIPGLDRCATLCINKKNALGCINEFVNYLIV